MSAKSSRIGFAIKLLFIAELLLIASVAVVFIPTVGGFIAGGCAIAAFLLNIIGLFKAQKDAPAFQVAFWLTIIGLIINALSLAFTNAAVWFALANNIIQILITLFVIIAIRGALAKYKEQDTADFGTKTFIIYAIAIILSAVLRLLIGLNVFNATGAISIILSCAVVLTAVVGYVMYLFFLGKSSKALNK